MKARLLKLLEIEPDEVERVLLLFVMGFFMGIFVAAISVASQTLFLQYFDVTKHLPIAFVVSGLFGLIATVAYNFLQNRIPFPLLATMSLAIITIITAFIGFGEAFISDPQHYLYAFGFTQILPFSFITYLIFWGSFGRLFNLRQAKRLVGSVDIGAMVATSIAFFSIPVLLTVRGFQTQSLYNIGLASVLVFIVIFIYLSAKHLSKAISFAKEKTLYKKLAVADFLRNRYILYMSLFIILSMMAMTFVNFSFLNVTPLQFDTNSLANFISLFEGTIVVFSFLFQVLATDRIIAMYGMRVSLLVSPVIIGFFTVAAFGLGLVFGTPGSTYFIIFFMMIAVSKLFMASLKDALDNPTFKLYLLPIESNIRIDVQTKVEGIVTAFASIIAGGIILIITQFQIFNLTFITLCTIPLIALWYFVVMKMHGNYRHTLQNTLVRNKEKAEVTVAKEYTINEILENQVASTAEDKVMYGLNLMEKLEPTLFENAVIRMTASDDPRIKKFAEEKVRTLGIEKDPEKTAMKSLAEQAASDTEDSDLLSISPEKLMKLSKSLKQQDRILAAKLLRRLVGPKTIFILLELLRDVDPKVRFEALQTARKTKLTETWPVLIEMLSSPLYGHYASAALIGASEKVLPTLEAAFHKSGQSDLVMLRIVQIMGRIGGDYALQLLWRKADYPDKRIVKQILYSLRYIKYRAQDRERRNVFDLLETEISKTMWNLAALEELPESPEFKFLHEALREEVTENYDQMTMLLSILYDPESVELVRANIESGDPDNVAFAMELLDLFIDPELKPKLVPLLDDSSTEEKLHLLQLHYPRESYTPIQVVNYILNRDFNLNNRWTKVCAVHASAFMPDFRVSRGLIAQVFNTDRLLQETAAWVVFQKDKKLFADIRERLPQRDKKFLDTSIENNQLLDGLDDGFFLEIEMVMFIKQLPVFRNIHGSLICDLADKITPVELMVGEKITLPSQEDGRLLVIVAHGQGNLMQGEHILRPLKKEAVHGELFHNGAAADGATHIVATERTILFKINLLDFYFVMANNHELVQGLIKNITQGQSEQTTTKPITAL